MKKRADIEYINLTLQGDINAFAYLVEKYQAMVLTIVNKIIKDIKEAEDIAQEVFLKAFKNLNSYKEKSRFSTWIYSIAYNEAVTAFNKSKKIQTTKLDNYYNNNDDKTEAELKETRLKSLDQALKLLKEDENIIITLFYIDNKSVEEIAEIMNLTVSNTKVKLFRIRKKLLKLMSDE